MDLNSTNGVLLNGISSFSSSFSFSPPSLMSLFLSHLGLNIVIIFYSIIFYSIIFYSIIFYSIIFLFNYYFIGKKLKKARYTELIDKDVLKFGFSTREYVVLNVDAHNLADDDEK